MRFLRNENGFTLVEVVASIIILSISLLLFSSFFVQNYRISKGQDSQMIAMNLARQTAEEWKSQEVKFDENSMEVKFDENSIEGTPPSDNETFNYLTLSSLKGATIELNPISINGRSYKQSIKISDIGKNDPKNSLDENTMLLLTVTVEDANNPGKTLATLNTGITEE